MLQDSIVKLSRSPKIAFAKFVDVPTRLNADFPAELDDR
jgi:hypothetical protein